MLRMICYKRMFLLAYSRLVRACDQRVTEHLREFFVTVQSMRLQRDLIIVLTVLSLMACGEATDTHAGQPVAHRRAAFKKILLAFEPIGVQLREKQYNSNRLIDQAKLLASLKNDPWSYFDADTNYPPTHAKAKIWSDPDQFRAAQQTFVQAVDRFALVVEDHDETHAKAAYEAVQESCRNCHKAFKD